MITFKEKICPIHNKEKIRSVYPPYEPVCQSCIRDMDKEQKELKDDK